MKKGKSWLQSSDYFGEPPHHILFKWSSDCPTLSFWPSKKVCTGSLTVCSKGLRLLAARRTGDASHPSWKKYLKPERRKVESNKSRWSHSFHKKKESLLAGMFSRKLLEDWEYTACWKAKTSTQFCSCYWDSGNHPRTRVLLDRKRNWVFQRTVHATIIR